MIRKIICPTDLSPAAQNASAYAAKLCQVTGATLELLHCEPVSNFELAFAGRRKMENVLSWSEELEHRSQELSKLFHISCQVDINTYKRPLAEVIAERDNHETLIVVGTNGTDTAYQQFFGSNTFALVRSGISRVLVIPEDVPFRTINKMALAWDYHLADDKLKIISTLAGELKAKLLFVHISRHTTLISEDVYRARRNAVEEQTGSEEEIEFQRVTADDVQKGLEDFMAQDIAEILVIPIRHGALMRQIFGSVAFPGRLPACPFLIISN